MLQKNQEKNGYEGTWKVRQNTSRTGSSLEWRGSQGQKKKQSEWCNWASTRNVIHFLGILWSHFGHPSLLYSLLHWDGSSAQPFIQDRNSADLHVLDIRVSYRLLLSHQHATLQRCLRTIVDQEEQLHASVLEIDLPVIHWSIVFCFHWVVSQGNECFGSFGSYHQR